MNLTVPPREITDGDMPTNVMLNWMQDVSVIPPISGISNPNGLIAAKEGKIYIDRSTAIASIFIKSLDSVGGNNKLGWQLMTGSFYLSEQRFQDFTNQNPSGVDIPTVVKYGAAITSPNGCVSVSAGGVFSILKTGPYLIKSNLRIARIGAGAAAHIHLWVEASPDNVMWTPVNVSIRITVDSNRNDDHLYDSSPIFLPAGTYIRTMFARDSSGANAGGLYSETPSAALTLYGVGPDPSASLEWHTVVGYRYE